MTRILFTVLLIISSTSTFAETLQIPESIWEQLSVAQQEQVTKIGDVTLLSPSQYGTVLQAQVLNQSTAGTNVGAALGAAYGQSNYIDKAFSKNDIDYSASGQVTAGVIGAIVGSMLDAPVVNRFITRYTIKTNDNQIRFYDQASASPTFTHPAGLCVLIFPMVPASQDLCSMTKADLLKQIDTPSVKPANFASNQTKASVTTNSTIDTVTNEAGATAKIKCKVGNNAPTLIDRNLCEQLNGLPIDTSQ